MPPERPNRDVFLRNLTGRELLSQAKGGTMIYPRSVTRTESAVPRSNGICSMMSTVGTPSRIFTRLRMPLLSLCVLSYASCLRRAWRRSTFEWTIQVRTRSWWNVRQGLIGSSLRSGSLRRAVLLSKTAWLKLSLQLLPVVQGQCVMLPT